MTSSQDKFFKVLDAELTSVNLDLVVSKTYENVGTITVQRAGDSFRTLLTVGFDFQGGGKTAHFTSADGIFTSKPNPGFAGFGVGSYDDAIDTIVTTACRNRDEDGG